MRGLKIYKDNTLYLPVISFSQQCINKMSDDDDDDHDDDDDGRITIVS